MFGFVIWFFLFIVCFLFVFFVECDCSSSVVNLIEDVEVIVWGGVSFCFCVC